MWKLSLISSLIFVLILVCSPCHAAANSKTDGSNLFNAVKNYQENTVRSLISKGAKINATDSKGNTPLICAVQTGSAEIVKLLLNSGAKVNIKNNDGYTAIDYAAEYATEENLKIINILAKAGGRINSNASPVLRGLAKAINGNNIDFAKKLINIGVNINARYDGKTPFLFLAASRNNPQMVDLFVASGANVNIGTEEEGSPLCAAIIGNINGQDYTSSFRENSISIAKLLIDSGANVNSASTKKSFTPLYWACVEESYNPEMVMFLLQSGADINAAKINGSSLLDMTKSSNKNKSNFLEYGQIIRVLRNARRQNAN